MRALGCHVFAGGFSMGVRRVMPVLAQLEIHDFGRETVDAVLGIPFINETTWEAWPRIEADFLFGNPRCTGFSTITSGYSDAIHGPFAKCTRDIRDLCAYGTKHDVPVIAWESVQQAYSVGRPLLDLLRDEVFAPRGYRICHMFLNAASFGNAQRRRRYFFVAYKRGRNFCVVPPPIADRPTTVRDVIEQYEGLETRACNYGAKSGTYDADTYTSVCREDQLVIPHLRPGEDFNAFARRGAMAAISPKFQAAWDRRLSDIPFSLHCPTRLWYDGWCPTLSSSCSNFIHPTLPRPITVREMSRLMGWPEGAWPRGPRPNAQVAKGICPEVGAWLAEQVALYLRDEWGSEDWSTRWNHRAGRWEGFEFTDEPLEKVIHMTQWEPNENETVHEAVGARVDR